MLSALTDGAISAATIMTGAAAIFIRPTRRLIRKRCKGYDGQCWVSQKVITDFLNGSTVVPFAGLAATAFYPSLIPLMLANKPAMAMAGTIGFLFVVGEIITAGRDD